MATSRKIYLTGKIINKNLKSLNLATLEQQGSIQKILEIELIA